MWWRHDRKHQLVKALENGYRVIMTPRRPLYADFVQYGGRKVGRVWGGYNTIEEDVYKRQPPWPYGPCGQDGYLHLHLPREGCLLYTSRCV